ncbi:hypothetical protein OIDMADRAFT_39319 [Oidiodendron maius Zn]|uniref:Uncharacterized protein n=1 Tax=Oidiodendron maius (strain Zn) TaxID=913774 RepID=A0A0C3HPA8_OIDMZ|nr:hypothetical protein OIDMADRAFT_39319 [Oidiodendron maius Zn]
MSKLRMPYQCIEKAGKFLVAARGSSIDLFSLDDLSLLSTWKFPHAQGLSTKGGTQSTTKNHSINMLETPALDTEPPHTSPAAKRRKLSDESSTQAVEAGERKSMTKPNSRSDSVASGLEDPAFITLASTRGGQHVIAVTGEDKTIRVPMPKRPCAITITQDNSTIIAADKFGDVYSLPLLFSELEVDQTPGSIATPRTESSSKPFTPAANELTVHSQRNRRALENQKAQSNKASEKPELTFEHRLLLGHVSMLTDVAAVDIQGRGYIISADRDEHIRVSRGIPQSHIIEGFCLGHTEFISRLCIPQGKPNLLISGGGDNELFVWDWLTCRLLSKTDLQSLIADVLLEYKAKNDGSYPKDEIKVTVSNIVHAKHADWNDGADMLLVTSEGVPALFTFLLTPDNILKHIQTVKLPGNALALTTYALTPEGSIIVSVDSIHKPGSITDCRSEAEATEPLRLYMFRGNELNNKSIFKPTNAYDEKQSVKLTNLLYNLENLRKRDGEAKEFE